MVITDDILGFNDVLKITKQERESWEAYCEELQRLEPDATAFETKDEKKARIDRLIDPNNYSEFCQYYFKKITRGTENAWFHNAAALEVVANDKLRAMFEWARGHAKTTHLGVILPLLLAARKEVKFVVIVGASENAAARTLSKIQAHLMYNKKYINDFGQQFKAGSWEEGEFTTLQGVKFLSCGRGQSPRGLNSDDSYRPDYIYVDDIDDDELCRNPKRLRLLIEWLYDALIGAMDMGRGRFVVSGNRISKNSVVAHFASKEGVHHLKINVYDDDGNVQWSEKYTKEEVEAHIKFLGNRSAQKELFNNPINVGTIFKEDDIIYGKIPPLHELDCIVAYTDPAKANTQTSCNKSTPIVGFLGKYIYLIDVFNENASMYKMINWQYDKYDELLQVGAVANWWFESIFGQSLYQKDYDEVGKTRKLGYTLPIIGDDRPKPEKFARIESISPYFERHEVIFNEDLYNTPHMKRAHDDLVAVEKGTRTPLDFPDALEGAIFKGRLGLSVADFDFDEYAIGERATPDGMY